MIESTSVSQVEAYGRCKQKWMQKSVRKRKEPFKAFAELGTQIHAQLKHYAATGENVLGKAALPAMKFIPPPKSPTLLLEHGLNDQPQPVDREGKPMHWFPPNQSFVRAAGIPFIGFFDLMDSGPDHVVSEGNGIRLVHEPGVIEALDYKSGKSFRYTKKAEELLYTPQMCGYGMFAVTKFPWATGVRLSHVPILTDPDKAPEARKESIVVTPHQIRETWASKVDPLVAQMNIDSEKKDEEVEGNLDACGDYGGCGFKDFCPTYQASLTTQNTLTRMKTNSMGLFNKAKTGAAAPVNGTANATPWITAAPPVVAAPPATKGLPTMTDHIQASTAQQGQKYLINGGEFMFMQVMGTKAVFVPVSGVGDPLMLDPATSVQLAPAAAPAAAAPAPVPPPPPAPVAVAAPPPPIPPPPPAVQTVRDAGAPPPPAPLAAAPEAAAEAPKRGRGRPRKETVPGQTIAAAQAATGFRLFINAVPSEQYTDLIGYVYEATGQLEEQFNVSDIRAAADDSPIGFGKYKGALAAMVKAEPPPPGVYVAFTEGNEFTAIVAEALASTCAPGQLVRGVR